jgi:NAD(P)-dependent dehydrogenase (short-subunit alcohol dehydrogenase family)
MKQFTGAVAVVTGGGSGLGKAFAQEAALRGMKVVIADIQQDVLEQTVAELNANGVETIGVKTDVSKASDLQALADTTLQHFGKVNLLFNNAGVTASGLVWENTERDWDWLLGVNLFGVIHGLRIFTPLMLAAAKADPHYEGHIVNTASMAGLLAGVGSGIYSVSKHAVLGLSEALYQDLNLLTEQLSCSVLCPSYVPTAIGESERNRPASLAADGPLTATQRIAKQISQESIDTGPVTAKYVADLTFEAIEKQTFYVYSHPETLLAVKNRFDNIVTQQNPPLTFEGNAKRSSRRTRLMEALRQ